MRRNNFGQTLHMQCRLPGAGLTWQGPPGRYGQTSMLVLTTGRGVNGFTLHPGIGEFILVTPVHYHPGVFSSAAFLILSCLLGHQVRRRANFLDSSPCVTYSPKCGKKL